MAEERSPEFNNRWCPWTCNQCRTDCVCCHWIDEKKSWVCTHNKDVNLIYRKKDA